MEETVMQFFHAIAGNSFAGFPAYAHFSVVAADHDPQVNPHQVHPNLGDEQIFLDSSRNLWYCFCMECKSCSKQFEQKRYERFCSQKCTYASRRTGNGHRYVAGNGYVYIKLHDHPDAPKGKGYVLEHRVVVEETLRRRLNQTEVVHHKNGIPTDNRPENLEVLSCKEHQNRHGCGEYLNTRSAIIKRVISRWGRHPKKIKGTAVGPDIL